MFLRKIAQKNFILVFFLKIDPNNPLVFSQIIARKKFFHFRFFLKNYSEQICFSFFIEKLIKNILLFSFSFKNLLRKKNVSPKSCLKKFLHQFFLEKLIQIIFFPRSFSQNFPDCSFFRFIFSENCSEKNVFSRFLSKISFYEKMFFSVIPQNYTRKNCFLVSSRKIVQE